VKDHVQNLLALTDPCPICGAGVGVPCKTKSGKTAKQPHTYRTKQKEN
jgi:hypothetical protein